MYQRCIFCSADLGINEAIETFPVGRRLAFDGWKGRLWAICSRCRRWNLAPLEERWEAVEEAEKRFRDCRVRVHSENIGLARMPDGTRLVRVGEAVPLELATWRYGGAMNRGRRRALIGTGVSLIGGTGLLLAGGPLLALGALPAAAGFLATHVAGQFLLMRQFTRPILQVPAQQSPSGKPILIRQQQSYQMRIIPAEGPSALAVEIPYLLPMERISDGRFTRWIHPDPLRLEGDLAHRFLERVLVMANLRGARRSELSDALARFESAGGADELMRQIASRKSGVYYPWMASLAQPDALSGGLKRLRGTFRGELIEARTSRTGAPLPRAEVLALEIALHEDAERRALEGELAALAAAWRQAEEIAAIADTLPDDPLERLNAHR